MALRNARLEGSSLAAGSGCSLSKLIVAGLDIVNHSPKIRRNARNMSMRRCDGGVPPSKLLTHNSRRLSLRPPRFTKAPPGFCSRIRSMDFSTRRVPPSFLHFLDQYFPMNRDGASNPGDGIVRYGTHTGHLPVCATAAVRKGSAVKMQSLAASPRPRH